MQKRLLVALMIAALVFVPFQINAAQDEYDDSQSNPLRILAYVIYPAAYLVEWVIFRPFHALVSIKGLDKVFGHTPHDDIKPSDEAARQAQDERT
jgi:hypothetical protein